MLVCSFFHHIVTFDSKYFIFWVRFQVLLVKVIYFSYFSSRMSVISISLQERAWNPHTIHSQMHTRRIDICFIPIQRRYKHCSLYLIQRFWDANTFLVNVLFCVVSSICNIFICDSGLWVKNKILCNFANVRFNPSNLRVLTNSYSYNLVNTCISIISVILQSFYCEFWGIVKLK
jgi:hypothetical protein